jgi:hypothetical protein
MSEERKKEKMDRSQLPKLASHYQPGDDRMLEDPGKNGKIVDSLSFKGTGLET